MEAKFKIGENLIIVGGPDKSKIGKEVVVVDTHHFVKNTKVSAVDMWEYNVKEDVKSLGWFPEYHLEPLGIPL